MSVSGHTHDPDNLNVDVAVARTSMKRVVREISQTHYCHQTNESKEVSHYVVVN